MGKKFICLIQKEGYAIPRPRKWRIVESIPGEIYFVPYGKSLCEIEEEILKVEEIEAIRLKDLNDLNQDECAQKMKISRQTFQRILSDARSKIAKALIEGRAIRVSGGDYTQQVCKVICPECNVDWEDSYENFTEKKNGQYKCPNCGYEELTCCGRKKSEFCANRCCGKTNSNF